MFDIDQLLTKTTPEEVKATMFTYMTSLGLPVTAWQAFSPTRILVDAFSRLFATLQNIVVDIVRAGFRDHATNGGLTLLSEQMYDVERVPATFASGTDCLIISNSGGGIYHFDPGELTVKNSLTGKTYHNTTVIDVGALQTGVVASLLADEIGAASNAAPGEITQLVTVALGLSATNVASVSGFDEETDEALRTRDLAKLQALSPNGAAGAYEYVALTPTLNGGVAVNRVHVTPAPGNGTVRVVVAGPLGPVSAPDLATLQLAEDSLATPDTVLATVASANPVAQSYNITVWSRRSFGFLSPDIQAMVRTALVNYIRALPIGGINFGAGGIIPWRAIIGAAENASPDNGMTTPIEQAILSVEADVALGVDDVATLDALSVVVNVGFTE
jgi:uncharacterized phage protein gp47/JayE